jgi:hypothetical protein
LLETRHFSLIVGKYLGEVYSNFSETFFDDLITAGKDTASSYWCIKQTCMFMTLYCCRFIVFLAEYGSEETLVDMQNKHGTSDWQVSTGDLI